MHVKDAMHSLRVREKAGDAMIDFLIRHFSEAGIVLACVFVGTVLACGLMRFTDGDDVD